MEAVFTECPTARTMRMIFVVLRSGAIEGGYEGEQSGSFDAGIYAAAIGDPPRLGLQLDVSGRLGGGTSANGMLTIVGQFEIFQANFIECLDKGIDGAISFP